MARSATHVQSCACLPESSALNPLRKKQRKWSIIHYRQI